jgi:hypothetical protein
MHFGSPLRISSVGRFDLVSPFISFAASADRLPKRNEPKPRTVKEKGTASAVRFCQCCLPQPRALHADKRFLPRKDLFLICYFHIKTYSEWKIALGKFLDSFGELYPG